MRLVRLNGGPVAIDRTGHAAGRGAYLCSRPDCFENGKRRIGGALRGAAVDHEALKVEFDDVVRSRG